jgi:hypothetical protein
VSYVDELSNALADVGISRPLRRRILDEIADHLACDPDAELGAPAQLAHQLPTSWARRGLGGLVSEPSLRWRSRALCTVSRT